MSMLVLNEMLQTKTNLGASIKLTIQDQVTILNDANAHLEWCLTNLRFTSLVLVQHANAQHSERRYLLMCRKGRPDGVIPMHVVQRQWRRKHGKPCIKSVRWRTRDYCNAMGSQIDIAVSRDSRFDLGLLI